MIQILIAVLAGVLTIAAPCILPLLPVLLGASLGQTSKSRPIFIVTGFIVVFTAVAILLSLFSQKIGLDPNIIRDLGVFILAIFGVLMIYPEPFEILISRAMPVFSRATSVGLKMQSNWGGFVLGMTLGLVWTPCAGPVLGSVLALIALQKEILSAGILLLAYSIGASVPMLVIAYGGQYISSRIVGMAKYFRAVQFIMGIVVILLAVAIYLNYDIKIYAKLLEHYPSLNPKF